MQEGEEQLDNTEKTKKIAKNLYPYEKWEKLDDEIYIAKSRIPRSAEQINILEKEVLQARLLAARGSTVYLLPETQRPGEKHIKFPDAIVDGQVMEFKTITGSIRQVEERYKEARVKSANIFMKIDGDLSLNNVMRKLSGYIRRKSYSGGVVLVYFSRSGEYYRWTEDELK